MYKTVLKEIAVCKAFNTCAPKIVIGIIYCVYEVCLLVEDLIDWSFNSTKH